MGCAGNPVRGRRGLGLARHSGVARDGTRPVPHVVFPGQPPPRGLYPGADRDGPERRDLHGLPRAGLQPRLGGRALDRSLHGDPADRPGHPRQAARPALAADRRGDGSRPLPGAVRQPGAGAGFLALDHVLHVLHDGRPVQGGGADHEDRLAGHRGTGARGRDSRHRRDRPGLLPGTGPVHGRGRGLHLDRRLPRRGLDRPLSERADASGDHDPASPGRIRGRRDGAGHAGRRSRRPTPASPGGRATPRTDERSCPPAWRSPISSSSSSRVWAHRRGWFGSWRPAPPRRSAGRSCS